MVKNNFIIGKRPTNLGALIAGLCILLAAVLLLTLVPGLSEISLSAIYNKASEMQSYRETIGVTSAPYSLPDYMWDIEVKTSETVDLRPLISTVATISPGILSKTGIRMKLGEGGSNYNLQVHWDTGSTDPLTLKFFDCLERPIGFQKDVSGDMGIIAPGGLYVLGLSCEGLLDTGFTLTVSATKTNTLPAFNIPTTISGIPTLAIQMSESSYISWDIQRAALLEQLQGGQTAVNTAGFKRVLADVVTEVGQTTVQLWESGVGIWINFSEETPSFTGKVVSGPLLFGMSRFKLHSIRTQEGLLDYVAESMMYDEGLLEPRCILVRASLNGREMGIYRLAEDTESDGFFAGVQRYDGQVSKTTILLANPLPPTGLVEQAPMTREEEYSAAFTTTLDKVNFAKNLAFSSRFQAAHGLTVGNLWFYRNPYLDSSEPLSHDLNIHAETETWPGLLVHTSWWLGTGLIEGAPYSTPAVFPREEELNLYTYTPWTLPISNAHPAAHQFLKVPENRELFDRYLLYAADPALQRRFAARTQSAFTAIYPFLTTDESLTLPGFGAAVRELPNEITWVTEQVDTVVNNRLITPRTIPALLERSRLLVDIDPAGVTSVPETRTVSLYNLSPFSARLLLPDYAHIDGDTISANGRYLSPSLLFPTVVSVDISQPSDNSFPLAKDTARRFLSLERLRHSNANAANTLVPFVDVQVPASRYDDFLRWLEANPAVTLCGAYSLPPERHVLVSELAPQDIEAMQIGVSSQYTSAPEIVILPLSLEENVGTHRLSLLISNFSSQAVILNLASLRWLNQEDKRILSSSIRAIWQLGETPVPAPYTTTQLGAANPIGEPRSELESPMVWTGALRGLLAGPADGSMPNCILVEIEFTEDGTRWLQIDANDLAESNSSSASPVKVIVHQLNQTYLSLELPELLQGSSYQELPASVVISVSGFIQPHSGDCAADGNDLNFWHVENPPESTEHWVAFDFGEPVTITGLAILPRQRATSQLWGEDHAVLQGSNASGGEAGWVGIARLFVDKTVLGTEAWHWLQYNVPNSTAFRHYRILIDDPTFHSIAEVKFKISEWAKPVVELPELVKQGLLEILPNANGSLPIVRFSDKDAIISDIIKIPAGYILEIEPGTNLRFAENAGILSYSPIRAIGAEDSPIIFGPSEEGAAWAGVAVVNASGTSEFRHVTMSQAAGGQMGHVQFSGGLSFMGTSVVLTDTTLQDFSSEDGLHLSGATYEINRLVVSNSHSDAVDSDWSYGSFTDVEITNAGGDALDFSGSLISVQNAWLTKATDKGVSVGEGSVVRLENINAISCHTGIAAKDGSLVTIIRGKLEGNEYGLLRYIKKPVYTYPEVTVTETIFMENSVNRRDEPTNIWTRRYDN